MCVLCVSVIVCACECMSVIVCACECMSVIVCACVCVCVAASTTAQVTGNGVNVC